MKNLELYAFDKLSKKLDELGFPKLSINGGFKLIKYVDMHQALEQGQITFDKQGIYFSDKDCKQPGYLFIQKCNMREYSFPKIHITTCDIVKNIINGKNISDIWAWSNSRVNDVIDRDTGEQYVGQVLKVCKKCTALLKTKYQTSEDWYKSLDKSILQYTPRDRTDIYGYNLKWNKISQYIREKNHYRCQRCHQQPRNEKDKQFWHVHHKDGIKQNNQESNLVCLCIRCHSQVDKRHQQNFSKGKQLEELQKFNRLYPQY